MQLDITKASRNDHGEVIKILPYPGGRHPRIGFHDGMLSPMRGTKVSAFLPWKPEDFIILDLPEAMFTQFGLTFLGHKHIPTYFDYRNMMIENSDWQRNEDGSLSNQWRLPNKMIVGAHVKPSKDFVDMELWIKNETELTSFTDIKSQVCVMFSYATQFNSQTNENKIFDHPVTAVKSDDGNQWILTAWNGCDRVWGNEDCPCMHSDPYLPVCPAGHTVRTTGRVWFYEGENIREEISRGKLHFAH